MVAAELRLVVYRRARNRDRPHIQPEDGLNEIVANAGPEFAARLAQRRVRVLEIGVADGDAVEFDGVPTHGMGFLVLVVSTVGVIWKRNSWSTSWLTMLFPIFAGLKRMNGNA